MVPMSITQEQAAIAEWYWQKSWTFLSAEHVQEALDWWYGIDLLDRILGRNWESPT